jgi:DNA polymerase
MMPLPPTLDSLPAGHQFFVGMGRATVLPDCDFETYSEAGHTWDEATQKWETLPGAVKKGLPATGAAAYAEHASTEVLSFKYDLKDGHGRRHWVPGMPNPDDLFAWLSRGGLIEAWNVGFERWIWNTVCVVKYGWPVLHQASCRCAMAKGRASATPGALDKAAAVLALAVRKDADGDRLIKKFSMPRNPTAKDKRTRLLPPDDPIDGPKLYAYNDQDIVVEAEASSRLPDLDGEELEFWLCDQAINIRGVQMDREGINNCIVIIDQAHTKYNAELYGITGGEVARASEIAKIQQWLHARGVHLNSLDDEAVEAALKLGHLEAPCRRVLEIRAAIGSAAVKKVYTMRNQLTSDGRLHDLFSYHAAHTGRATGNGPQPTNLPNSGPAVLLCSCGKHCGMRHKVVCPWCGAFMEPGQKPVEWCAASASDALEVIATQSLETLEFYFGDAMYTIAGCLRGLFIAAPGHDLICSDYSAIEAVGAAMMAGEEWRIDVFRTHGKIYEMSASMITGVPFEEMMRYKAETGNHHPTRKTIGKIAELASGYQGWIGSWKAFGADEYFTDEEIKDAILKWRAKSPKIVEIWGGQARGKPWEASHRAELFGMEGAFVAAVSSPGKMFSTHGMEFTYRSVEDALYLRLLSGRYITYRAPRLTPGGRDGLSLSYEGWNTNPKNGPMGWIRKNTWGGRLFENADQATCRDILRHAIVNLERAGYQVVLHVYDEIVAEVPQGWGSIEEFERIMATMPAWAADWPIKATGGWRQKRYCK